MHSAPQIREVDLSSRQSVQVVGLVGLMMSASTSSFLVSWPQPQRLYMPSETTAIRLCKELAIEEIQLMRMICSN